MAPLLRVVTPACRGFHADAAPPLMLLYFHYAATVMPDDTLFFMRQPLP